MVLANNNLAFGLEVLSRFVVDTRLMDHEFLYKGEKVEATKGEKGRNISIGNARSNHIAILVQRASCILTLSWADLNLLGSVRIAKLGADEAAMRAARSGSESELVLSW